MDREVSISTYLNWLSRQSPRSWMRSSTAPPPIPSRTSSPTKSDPLATFGHNDLQAVLSPIGLVHLFRQYFFEFDTFLGPPVGHIWLPPGATLELVEETTRRTLTERTVETLVDALDRTEKTDTVHDELSTAIREENRTNTKFGFGTNVNYDNGTTEVGANTDLSLDNSRTSARETRTSRCASSRRRSLLSTGEPSSRPSTEGRTPP